MGEALSDREADDAGRPFDLGCGRCFDIWVSERCQRPDFRPPERSATVTERLRTVKRSRLAF